MSRMATAGVGAGVAARVEASAIRRRATGALGVTLLVFTASCAPLEGGWGDIFGGRNSITGEVRSVDTRRSTVRVREDYGSERSLRYDSRTRVVNGQRQYSVSSLERGDRVRVQVTHDRNGTAWADRIEVREDARSTSRARTQRIDGRIGTIDHRRGYFTTGTSRSALVVYMPSRPSRDDARRFDRLRRGDRVRADVRTDGRGAAELVRFR